MNIKAIYILLFLIRC